MTREYFLSNERTMILLWLACVRCYDLLLSPNDRLCVVGPPTAPATFRFVLLLTVWDLVSMGPTPKKQTVLYWYESETIIDT
jgi:hypothetical protein